jgi:hypothetical protein
MTRGLAGVVTRRLAAASLAVLLLGAACGPTKGESTARRIALEFWTTTPREPGARPIDPHITGSHASMHEGHAGWEVSVDGAIGIPAAPEGYANPMILFVDGLTGQVIVIAQG